MALLGLDYGGHWIGIAVSQSGIVAQGIGRVENSNGGEIEHLRGLCQQYKVSKIVLGLPKSLHHQKIGPAAQLIKLYGAKLEKELHLHVYFEDETLTSAEVERNYLALGWKREKIDRIIDEEAAKLILQNFIDRKR
jgi:putative Holliday junction resolvase